MLPFENTIFEAYNRYIKVESFCPWDRFCKAWAELNQLMDLGIGRLAMNLSRRDRAVVAMNDNTVIRISEEAIAHTRRGDSHGVCKGGNFPQKSLAVLTGLAQFGISRSVFRDEVVDGKVKRYLGVLRSIVLFDSVEAIEDGEGGMLYLTEEWRQAAMKLSDFTQREPEINRHQLLHLYPGAGGSGLCEMHHFLPLGGLVKFLPENRRYLSREPHPTGAPFLERCPTVRQRELL